MDNPVVLAIQQAYFRQGFNTLRFNFRGVGASAGRFDNGVGERADVQAAITWAAGLGITDIDLAGYSFGACVNAGLGTSCRRMVMVSPPVAFMDFGPPAAIERLRLIVTGDRDILQVVDEAISVLTSGRQFSDTIIYTPEAIEQKYGLRPDQLRRRSAPSSTSARRSIPGRGLRQSHSVR